MCFWVSQCEDGKYKPGTDLHKLSLFPLSQSANTIYISSSSFYFRVFQCRGKILIIFSRDTNRHCYSKAGAFSREGKLTPWLQSSTTFVLPKAVNSTMRTCVRLKTVAAFAQTCAWQFFHTSSQTPFTYLLTKLGTCTPTHENTPSTRARPDNKNMTIHTFMSWVGKKKKPWEKQPV